MSDEEITSVTDYSDLITEIITNQQAELDELRTHTAILQEEINGLTIIANFQNTTLAFFMVVIAIILVWNVVAKWLFRGV